MNAGQSDWAHKFEVRLWDTIIVILTWLSSIIAFFRAPSKDSVVLFFQSLWSTALQLLRSQKRKYVIRGKILAFSSILITLGLSGLVWWKITRPPLESVIPHSQKAVLLLVGDIGVDQNLVLDTVYLYFHSNDEPKHRMIKQLNLNESSGSIDHLNDVFQLTTSQRLNSKFIKAAQIDGIHYDGYLVINRQSVQEGENGVMQAEDICALLSISDGLSVDPAFDTSFDAHIIAFGNSNGGENADTFPENHCEVIKQP